MFSKKRTLLVSSLVLVFLISGVVFASGNNFNITGSSDSDDVVADGSYNKQ
jgi:hypothetical protein